MMVLTVAKLLMSLASMLNPSAFTLKYFSASFHLLRSQKLWFSR